MASVLKEAAFQKRLLWLNGSIPALMLLFDFSTGRLGANPPEAIIRTTGIVAIVFLVLTLAVSPIAHIWKQTWLVKHRRWLGLWSFYYALMHLLSYSVFDKELKVASIAEDIAERPFILLGFLGFVMMIPLAITSTNDMIKKLGAKRWRNLHKLTFAVAPIVALHFFLIVKSDIFWPVVFAVLFALVLAYRLAKKVA